MIPLGIVWAGYTLVFYGYCLIKGPGIGLTDLIKPSGLSKVATFLNGNTPSSGSTTGAVASPNTSAATDKSLGGAGGAFGVTASGSAHPPKGTSGATKWVNDWFGVGIGS